MANDFDRFLGAVTAGTALDARPPGQRFVPPAVPEPGWHAVRDDLEDTLQNLHAIRDALLTLQRSLEALQAPPGAPGPAEPPAGCDRDR